MIAQSPPRVGFSGVRCCFGFAVTAGAVVEPDNRVSPGLGCWLSPSRAERGWFCLGVVGVGG